MTKDIAGSGDDTRASTAGADADTLGPFLGVGTDYGMPSTEAGIDERLQEMKETFLASLEGLGRGSRRREQPQDEREREAEEKRRDTELAAEIAQRKKNTNERGIKLTAVLMASRKMLGVCARLGTM